LWPSFQ